MWDTPFSLHRSQLYKRFQLYINMYLLKTRQSCLRFLKKHQVCKLYYIFGNTTGISLTLLVMNQQNTTPVPFANVTYSHKNYLLYIH